MIAFLLLRILGSSSGLQTSIEHVDFRFAQLYSKAAQAVASTLTITAHAFGGSVWHGLDKVHCVARVHAVDCSCFDVNRVFPPLSVTASNSCKIEGMKGIDRPLLRDPNLSSLLLT